MKSLDRMIKLAQRFEKKVAQQVSQSGTTELFFDTEENQRKFAALVNSQQGSAFKALSAHWAKTEQPCGFTLAVTATPSSGASWDLEVTPPSLTPAVKASLDAMYKSVMKVSMADRLKKADALAKTGSGSGTLKIGSLELS